jgi:hypothetical protein
MSTRRNEGDAMGIFSTKESCFPFSTCILGPRDGVDTESAIAVCTVALKYIKRISRSFLDILVAYQTHTSNLIQLALLTISRCKIYNDTHEIDLLCWQANLSYLDDCALLIHIVTPRSLLWCEIHADQTYSRNSFIRLCYSRNINAFRSHTVVLT